jgi:hypothetical protein
MIWFYILIYFLGAIITWLIVYTLYVKQYIKEQSNLKFNYWVEEYYFDIIFLAAVWCVVLPVWIIKCAIKAITKKINKHYNIE